MHRRGSRLAIALGTTLFLIVLALTLPTRAQPAPLLPPDITATLPLGDATTRPLTLNNPTNQPITITLYEAYHLPETAAVSLISPLPVEEKIAPALRAAFAESPDATSEIFVTLSDQPDLTSAYNIADWAERGNKVYDMLTTHAARSQAGLVADLTQRGYPVESFWIVNAITVHGDAQLAEWLARRSDVARLTENQPYVLPPLTEEEAPPSIVPGSIVRGIRQIGADTVWRDFGVEGQGIVVAALDSGATYTHTLLADNYRGAQGTTLSNDYNWADLTAATPSEAPLDLVGHGTHVLGTMVGRRGDDVVQVGIAPQAQWIAARGCATSFCYQEDLLEAGQWLLAPTTTNGDNPRPDLRPHIINNSWSFGGGEPWYEGMLTAWRAAGIAAPFAAGNNGGCAGIDRPALSANAFAVGATTGDGNTIARFSAKGPTYDGRVKPDIVAPGTGVYSAYKTGGYRSSSGTSMATPHVAGAVALLWSANPALIGEVAATEQLLRDTAAPLFSEECGDSPTTTPNNVFGAGRLDVAAAVRQAGVAIPWLQVPAQVVIPAQGTVEVPVTLNAAHVTAIGTYEARLAVSQDDTVTHTTVRLVVVPAADTVEASGRLIDAATGSGLSGQVYLTDEVRVATDGNGFFTFQVPRGTYPLTATAIGYLPFTTTVSVTDTSALALSLVADLPVFDVIPPVRPISATLAFGERMSTTVTIRNPGTQPLTVTASIPTDEWIATPLTTTTLYDMGQFPALRLGDEDVYERGVLLPFQVPLFGRYITRLYPGSNGWISTTRIEESLRVITCLPTGFTVPGTLVPFWADLDPSRGGSIKAGRIDSNTFVISYEQVPLAVTDPMEPVRLYSFQVVFFRDGHIEYRYGQMGRFPDKWVAGMSATFDRGQMLGCHDEPRLLGYRAWRLENQTNPRFWAYTNPAPVVVAPGQTQTLVLTLQGYVPAPWRTAPMEARLVLDSNDPRHSSVQFPIRVSIADAPFYHYIPFGVSKSKLQFP